MAINFYPGGLADKLSYVAGYKSGLALSTIEICDHLGGDLANLIVQSETKGIRIRSEEYEQIYYRLLHRIGYTEVEYKGDHTGAWMYHKYKRQPELLDKYEAMLTIYREEIGGRIMAAAADPSLPKLIDPKPFLIRCKVELGGIGLVMAYEYLDWGLLVQRVYPWGSLRTTEWESPIALAQLFSASDQPPEKGRFIDQRYVDYLSNNADRLPEMHWRKFEQLTAEFFEREGFRVDLGPGSNDDGVDVRVWRPGSEQGKAKPLYLVQCKRQKAKVEKVVIKGLSADVQFEGAEYGVIVTTSTLSPGALSTISARGYPIEVVEQEAVKKWLKLLRTPGTGIVRY
ncbi:restriction endonuclease [Pseudomonas aeruginosa]|uniref:restriction endonuclease n=1 Tax=Pseudomonas aeruginosa TaxID=287 RepID=UPI00093720BA|nr:restriction endonuclease [Pseudomonas aeruginosa]MCT5519314.1 restriction endonuclease [Pseudomonas aeruginosa]MEE2515669.1 restriction endonuclease [Pseudomonas aeruginosa]HEJ1327450.1 restriction endonuclease [Pseudomonas aeruginosa]